MPRFSMRDLMWLVVVLAIAIGWWVDHWRQMAMRGYTLEQFLAGLLGGY